eukprot:1161005-Pelagomonas_calceolata.AAC.3
MDWCIGNIVEVCDLTGACHSTGAPVFLCTLASHSLTHELIVGRHETCARPTYLKMTVMRTTFLVSKRQTYLLDNYNSTSTEGLACSKV